MPYTSPNQNTVRIHREPHNNNFLGINNDNWKYAARVLGAQAFLLYIYFASNKDGFVSALSPKAIHQEIGMPPSTYRDQKSKLESMGFLVPGNGNMLHFYEDPRRVTQSQTTDDALNSQQEKITAAAPQSTAYIQESPPEDIQIYIYNKDKETNTPKEQMSTRTDYQSRSELREKFHF